LDNVSESDLPAEQPGVLGVRDVLNANALIESETAVADLLMSQDGGNQGADGGDGLDVRPGGVDLGICAEKDREGRLE
jgi:hypothetical protein